MKPNELQIGDWATCESKNGKVKELREHKLSLRTENSVMIVYYNNVEPIPLTPEILVKNGFKECTDGYWINDNVDFVLHRMRNGNFAIQNTNMTLPYVSSFQHALQLCGIENEIEL